jgi:hypothetical protein
MRYVLIILAILVIVLIALALMFGGPQGPSFEDIADRAEPQIVNKVSEKVIVVTAKGNPNDVGGLAFGTLMKAYFKVPGAVKWGPGLEAPRARWPLSADVPMEEWIGRYAMPVPKATTELPEMDVPKGLKMELTTWEYGEVAEILHVGPYDSETPTVEKLMAFVAESGYEVAGEHEEEYLKGPGMLFAGDDGKYLTIIRYEVRVADVQTDSTVVLE